MADRFRESGLSSTEKVFVLSSGTEAQSGYDIADATLSISLLTAVDLIIAVDALKTSSMERLCSVIQISDGGICPGSAVGNRKKPITKDMLGIPVISIGIPMVMGLKQDGGEYKLITPADISFIAEASANLIFEGIKLSLF